MKKIIAILLCSALLAGSVAAQTNDPAPPPSEDMTLSMCALLIGVSLTAVGLTIYVWHKCKVPANHKVVLYRDHYDDQWVPIYTNCITVSTNKFELFRDKMTEVGARYRVKDEGPCN